MLQVHVHVHAVLPSLSCHVHANAAFSCSCCMSKYMLRVHVHSACSSTYCVYVSCFMPMSMLHSMSMPQVNVHALYSSQCSSPCSTDMDMLHGHGHTAWTETCSIYMGMQHVHGHAACTGTCSMDMDTQNRYGPAAWTLVLSPFKIYCIFTQISFRFVSPQYLGEMSPKLNETPVWEHEMKTFHFWKA
jgi:hypothetical protein